MKIKDRFDLITAINIAVFFAILEYSIYSLLCYSFEFNGHPFYGIPKMQLGFADLRQLTHSCGCSTSIDELLKNSINCDPFSRLFKYTENLLSVFLDASVQPILFAVLAFIIFKSHTFNVLFNWISLVRRVLQFR